MGWLGCGTHQRSFTEGAEAEFGMGVLGVGESVMRRVRDDCDRFAPRSHAVYRQRLRRGMSVVAASIRFRLVLGDGLLRWCVGPALEGDEGALNRLWKVKGL